MEYFLDNRSVIKNFCFNTGTSSSPVYTKACTASELSLNTDFTEQTFMVFCDALQRAVKTGVAMTIEGTIKIDINNAAITKVLGDIHTLITSGTISQFNNQLIKFDLLDSVNNSTLVYKTYICNASYSLESLGGAAEDVSEFAITLTINGTGTLSA